MSIFAEGIFQIVNDILGKALLDYQNGNHFEDIVTFSSLDEKDSIPLPYLFRAYSDMPLLEQKALELCKGDILDIGCGAGSHSLYLQQKGFAVTALDSSEGSVQTCRLRGVKSIEHHDIHDFSKGKFDTLLMLMNGIGIVGQLHKLGDFFNHLKNLLKPGGQILLDSSDIIYMFEEDEDEGRWVPDTSYYGEVEFTLQYKGHKSEPFLWLYVDYYTLKDVALSIGLTCELVSMGQHFDYLVRICTK